MNNGAVGKIPFTDEHIEKIRDGEKLTTMRTVKTDNLYYVGKDYRLADDLIATVTSREVILFGKSECRFVDEGREFNPGSPANHDFLRRLEGFDSIEDMFDWFESRNYELPQPFFLYAVNPREVKEQ